MRKKLTGWGKDTHTAISLGTFDGVHLGHKYLFNKLRKIAKDRDLKSLIFTFPLPPRNFLGENERIRLILPPEEKLKLLDTEADYLLIADFPSIRDLTPREFVREILLEKLNMKALIVGYDHQFGKDQQGDIETLKKLSRDYHFHLTVVDPLIRKGSPISSTRIRKAIMNGDIEIAVDLLGYSPHIYGKVIAGDRRGRKLGFPTLNLSVKEHQITPDQGIYAAYTQLESEKKEPSLLYIGNKPTFNGEHKSFEIHLIDRHLEGNMLGEDINASIVSKIRDDNKFPDPQSLIERMRKDVQTAKKLFRLQ